MISAPTKFFNVLKLCLEQRQPAPNYGGYVVNVSADHISQYYRIHKELPHNLLVQKGKYCNGRFYVLSQSAVNQLVTKIKLFDDEYFEDYAIGKYLDNSLKDPIFSIDTLKNFRDITDSEYKT
jgi:hypothetical protein